MPKLDAKTMLVLCLWLVAALPASAQVTVERSAVEVGTTLPGFAINGIDVAVGADGNLIFLWDNGNNDPTNAEYPADWNSLSARVYTPDLSPLGPLVRVDSTGNVDPWVFVGANGDGYLAAWQVAFPGEQSMQVYLRGRRLDADGTPLGEEFLIDSDGVSSKDVPVVAGLAGGGSAVAWFDAGTIQTRSFDAAAQPVVETTTVDAGPSSWNAHAVTGLTNGNFVVVWSSPYPRFVSALRLYSAEGVPLGGPLPVSDSFLATDVAANPNGGFAVIGKTWSMRELWLRQFDDDGTPLTDDTLVHRLDTDYYIGLQALAFGSDKVLVEWADYTRLGHGGIFGRVFDAEGQAIGHSLRISEMPALRLRAARLPDGRIVNAWESMSAAFFSRTAVWSNVVSICDAESCGGPAATPTQSPLPSPTAVVATPTPAPFCGDGNIDPKEECDDGNRQGGDGCDPSCRVEKCGNGRVDGLEQCDDGNERDGDGCQSDCTLTPRHDSVMVAEKAIDIVIPSQHESHDKVVPLQVRNADDGERPGHVIRLIAEDGSCPAGTVHGRPDFDRGREGDQDTELVPGGTPRTALLTIRVNLKDFERLERHVPKRCVLRFTAVTLVEGNIDPTPENNSIEVELNVKRAGHDDDRAAPGVNAALPEFFIRSAKPLRLRIRRGAADSRKTLPIVIGSGRGNSAPQMRTLAVAVDPGTCPADTFAGIDLGGGQAEAQLGAGRSRHGRLRLNVASASFASPNGKAARCQARLVVTSPDGDSAAQSHTTRLLLEVVDHNDR